MANNNILLSICIPTYNRSAVLRETLESITSQDGFSDMDEVEIVISDNASTDDTPLVAAEFVSRFPGKVLFYRQTSNIWTANFHQALSLGSGQYLKLHNDTLLVRQGALGPLLDTIREFANSRPVIFMTNGNRVKEGKNLVEHCRNLDEFVQNVSFFSTWIGGFGLWREDLALSSGFCNDTNHLVQTGIVCKQVSEGRPAIVFFGNYFLSKQDFRGTYNWAEVFGKNYLDILKKYVSAGKLAPTTYAQAKQEVLLRHILPTYFNTKNIFAKTDFFENLADYREDAYFHQVIADRLPLLWRLCNPHNQIELHNVNGSMLLSRVRAGVHSRGAVNVLGSAQGEARLDIGCFVTIGVNVIFVVGEQPPAGHTFSNYWTAVRNDGVGSIVVADDAWIGSGTVLHSGVTVGQGAIIAAGSVVTEDVPPYAKVSGNPAAVVGYRFEPEFIERLSAFDFSAMSDEVIARVDAAMLMPLDKNNLDAFLKLLEAAGLPPRVPASAATQEPMADAQLEQRVPAVLLLDAAGRPQQVASSLAAFASGPWGSLPVIVLTTQLGEVPEWTDSLRYVQASEGEFANMVDQLRMLPDFEWVSVIEVGESPA